MQTLGFAGVAKNTGKTTTALAVLHLAGQDGLRLCLTSIGYDGEERDHVTGLPKPRYALPGGCLVASAQRCLQASPAGLRILHTTDIQTILGPIQIAEVIHPGLVLIAGPNQQTQIEAVLAEFAERGGQLGLLDGALNRLMPLAAADGLLISTGAAFDEDPTRLLEHAAAFTALFRLPTLAEKRPVSLPHGSLLGAEQAAQLGQQLRSGLDWVSLPGAAAPQHCLNAARQATRPVTWCFGNPLRMMAAGDPRDWQAFINLVQNAQGGRVGVAQPIPLYALTINPFYPRYLAAAGRYEPAYLPAANLLAQAQAALPQLPILDLQLQGAEALRPWLPFLRKVK